MIKYKNLDTHLNFSLSNDYCKHLFVSNSPVIGERQIFLNGHVLVDNNSFGSFNRKDFKVYDRFTDIEVTNNYLRTKSSDFDRLELLDKIIKPLRVYKDDSIFDKKLLDQILESETFKLNDVLVLAKSTKFIKTVFEVLLQDLKDLDLDLDKLLCDSQDYARFSAKLKFNTLTFSVKFTNNLLLGISIINE